MNKLSICIIAQNEEKNIAKCLDSIVNYVDEIIVVDTGSKDKTKEIALKYTNKVFDYVWKNDFSAARNYAIDKASNEYILVVDCDEVVEKINLDELNILIDRNPKLVGRVIIINEYSRKGVIYRYNERLSRLFSKGYYKYGGVIHEQITPIGEIEMQAINLPITIKHFGYDGDLEIRKKKTMRNIVLLLEELMLAPNDPYILYQLGKSYYMQEDYINSCKYFSKALYVDLDIKLEYVQDMVESYGYSLLNLELYETSLQLLNVYDEFSKNADFIFLVGLIFMNNMRYEEAVNEFIKATTIPQAKMEGVNSYLAYYNIGVIHECLGNVQEATKNYMMCGNYNLAINRLQQIRKVE